MLVIKLMNRIVSSCLWDRCHISYHIGSCILHGKDIQPIYILFCCWSFFVLTSESYQQRRGGKNPPSICRIICCLTPSKIKYCLKMLSFSIERLCQEHCLYVFIIITNNTKRTVQKTEGILNFVNMKTLETQT